MINFNVPPQVGTEINYIKEAARNHKICGDGAFTAKCHKWLKEYYDIPSAYLTTSGTSALEMAALLCDIKEGDEVLLPSFTFCSTADAFVQRGAKLVFCDIRPVTLRRTGIRIMKIISRTTAETIVSSVSDPILTL